MDPLLFRSIERIVSVLIGGFSIYLGYRLFSSQAYGNGCFAFEVALPAGSADQGGEWIVHVHPTEADEDTRVEFRVQPRVAGARR